MQNETTWISSETPDDLNTCPRCNAVGEFQEFAKRWTHQPVKLGRAIGDDGQRGPVEGTDYQDFDWADDVEVTGYGCRGCCFEWSTLDALLAEQREAWLRELVRDASEAEHDDDPPTFDESIANAEERGRLAGLAEALRLLEGSRP